MVPKESISEAAEGMIPSFVGAGEWIAVPELLQGRVQMPL
jgi:hypothetical protein